MVEASRSGELKWLYEHIVERLPGLARLPARTSVLIQLLLMEALGLVLGKEYGVGPLALARGSLLIVAVALWSQVLLAVAPRLRFSVVVAGGQRRGGLQEVMAAYRRWLFHPWHLEAAPGLLMFIGAWIMLLHHHGGEGTVLEWMLGRSSETFLLLPVVLLSWDVCYRLGVGLWVAVFSGWRSYALAQVLEDGAEGGRILTLLELKWLRRMDRTLLLFPFISALVLLLFLPWAVLFYHLLGVTATTAGLGIAVLRFDGACIRATVRQGKARAGSRNLATGKVAGQPRLGRIDNHLGPLKDGARVAIIGAGPAGSLCAYFLRRMAKETGREFQVTLFDYKDFGLSGPRGCNMCAGVISGNLSRHLEAAEIHLPEEIIQSHIAGYRIITQAGEASLFPPAGAGRIVSVFRGNGPKFSATVGNVSFDDFLLENTRALGVEVIEEAVRGISLPGRGEGPAVITYGHREAQRRLEADVVVGAFGLSGNMPSLLKDLGIGYEPPESLRACQAEAWVGSDHISRVGKEHILVFSLGLPRMSFAALTPKKEHFTVTLVGQRPVQIPDLVAFLGHPRVREFLPKDWEPPEELCHCHPLVAVKGARAPFTDRLVVIGDASYSRYFKNGLESAFHTALFAAQTMVNYGISEKAFRRHYYPLCRREIIRDNAYGKLLFSLHARVAASTAVAQAQMDLFHGGSPSAQAFQRAAWDLFTGEKPYRTIARELARPQVMLRLLGLTAKRLT
jgi:flavin-dependent dehydrogenase